MPDIGIGDFLDAGLVLGIIHGILFGAEGRRQAR